MKKYHPYLLLLIFCFLLSPVATAQVLRVELNRLTTLDDEDQHLILFTSQPGTKLILPSSNSEDAKFFEIFYTWEVKTDPHIEVMLIRKQDADALFVDVNNDEDLTNDGPPILFPHKDNSVYFDIVSNTDAKQKTRIALRRQPEMPDSFVISFVDKEGNLQPKLAKMYGMLKGVFDYDGKKGTFYFDDRVTLHRGKLTLDDEIIQIGLFDHTNNGLFNDDDDLLIVDLDGNGQLKYGDSNEVYKLNDIFTIGTQNYQINKLDKYGEWLELIPTNEPATFYYLQELQENRKRNSEGAVKHAITGELEQSFWERSFVDLNDKRVNMKDFKGKFLLLNFWGEWCKPCLVEIPDLVESKNRIPSDKFAIISFAKSARIDLLKKVIFEKKMDWTQILLPEELAEKFKIVGYPTNILILGDGKSYVRNHAVDYGFISSYVH